MERTDLAAAFNERNDGTVVLELALVNKGTAATVFGDVLSVGFSEIGSSASTILPSPPSGSRPPVRIASRKRCIRNQLDL
jgi:hypothetical protein